MKTIKRLILLFQIALGISGITAFFLPTCSKWLMYLATQLPIPSDLFNFIEHVHSGIHYVDSHFNFIFYGTDWLAFAHLVIVMLFIGPYRNPVQNIWVIEFGMLASLLVIPAALLMGEIRNIPLIWRLVDCSFGIIALPLLIYIHRLIRRQITHNDHFKIKFTQI